MKTLSSVLVLGLAMSAATPALAQDADRAGSIQVKLLGTAVLPDGEITDVKINTLGVAATSQSTVNDNIIPSVAIEYFIANNFSIETIAGVTQHDVDGAGALAGAELISDLKLIPATVTGKFHLDVAPGIKPYLGAGVAYFMYFDDSPGSGVVPLGITDTDLTDEFGFALQAGLDFALNEEMGLSLDAKRYFMDVDARFFDDGVEVLRTEHRLDPWVLSAGVSWMF